MTTEEVKQKPENELLKKFLSPVKPAERTITIEPFGEVVFREYSSADEMAVYAYSNAHPDSGRRFIAAVIAGCLVVDGKRVFDDVVTGAEELLTVLTPKQLDAIGEAAAEFIGLTRKEATEELEKKPETPTSSDSPLS